MEAFESFVAVALEADGFVVSSAVKFDVKLKTKKAAYEEFQSHGYEVDLIGARADRLVLATVKSFLGSRGVVAEHVTGATTTERWQKLYALLNNDEIRRQVVEGARDRYGYSLDQIELRLYVGRFAAPTKGTHETAIRVWANEQHVGAGPIKVFGLGEVVGAVRPAADRKQYRDDPVLVTLNVLQAAGQLTAAQPLTPLATRFRRPARRPLLRAFRARVSAAERRSSSRIGAVSLPGRRALGGHLDRHTRKARRSGPLPACVPLSGPVLLAATGS